MAEQKPVFLGPDGQPFNRQRLLVEQAAPSLTSVRQIVSGHPADGLDPIRLGRLLRDAETGNATAYLELAEQMEERDLHYLGVIGKRKRAVCQLDFTVVDAGKDAVSKQAGDLIRRFLGRLELQDEIFDILDATGKGFSVTEILWDTSGGPWLPKKLKHRDPRWFHHSLEDGETLEMWDNDGFKPLPPYQFIHHVTKAKSGLPIRGGLARAVAWAYLFKNFDIKSWVVFAEAYGHPLRVGKYGLGSSAEDRAALLKALRNIASDAAAMIPASMEIEFVEAKMSGNVELFERMADWFDRQVSKAVLGNTGTTDAIAGGHAVGKVHKQVEEDIERSDAKSLEATLNRDLVRAIVDLNLGPQAAYPLLRIVVEDQEDMVQFANAIGPMIDRGLAVDQDEVRKRLGISEPGPNAKLMLALRSGGGGVDKVAPDPATPVPVSGAKTAVNTSSTAVQQTDAIDALVASQMADWQPMVSPMVQPILDIAAECSTPEEFLGRLPEVLNKMDMSKLTDALARSMFAARLGGYTGADLADQ
jgi:phage gp29-like protein